MALTLAKRVPHRSNSTMHTSVFLWERLNCSRDVECIWWWRLNFKVVKWIGWIWFWAFVLNRENNNNFSCEWNKLFRRLWSEWHCESQKLPHTRKRMVEMGNPLAHHWVILWNSEQRVFWDEEEAATPKFYNFTESVIFSKESKFPWKPLDFVPDTPNRVSSSTYQCRATLSNFQDILIHSCPRVQSSVCTGFKRQIFCSVSSLNGSTDFIIRIRVVSTEAR